MNIYLDNAATTEVDAKVIKAMLPYLSKFYGNASEYHQPGRKAKEDLEKTRKVIANFLNAQEKEIYFTSGATESINLAIKGVIEAQKENFKKGDLPNIITSTIEHKAVIESCKHLEKTGLATVTYLPVDSYGLVKIENLIKSINKNTVLVSIMYVNNEVGTIEPISKIGRLIKNINTSKKYRRVYFHTDATQAIGYLNCGVKYLNVDLLSFTGHKNYAPKGIGVLYKKSDVQIIRQMDGGSQEQNLRASTENIPSIIALGKAIEIIAKNKISEAKRIKRLRDELINKTLKTKGVKLTGHPTKRVAHIASFVIDGVEGEALVMHLSNRGIYASTGSACTANDLNPSHVLTAMHVPPEVSHGSLRLSLGRKNTLSDINITVKKLDSIIKILRSISPKIIKEK